MVSVGERRETPLVTGCVSMAIWDADPVVVGVSSLSRMPGLESYKVHRGGQRREPSVAG